jgi:ATP adenylyltransferase
MSEHELKRIWAPWRISYILQDKTKDCIFCAKGRADISRDTENLVLERGEQVYVLMNTYPYTPGHMLICPYHHIATPEDLSPEVYHELWDMTLKWRVRLKNVMNPQGMNMGLNLGDVAGAGIAEHLHVHIVPRWKGDTNFMTTCSNVRVVSQSLHELYEQLLINT